MRSNPHLRGTDKINGMVVNVREETKPDPGVMRTPLLSPFARKSPYLKEASAAEMYSSNLIPDLSIASHIRVGTHLDSHIVITALEPPTQICVNDEHFPTHSHSPQTIVLRFPCVIHVFNDLVNPLPVSGSKCDGALDFRVSKLDGTCFNVN